MKLTHIFSSSSLIANLKIISRMLHIYFLLLSTPHFQLYYFFQNIMFDFYPFIFNWIFFYFFFKTLFVIVDSQCPINFLCIAKWPSYTYIYIFFSYYLLSCNWTISFPPWLLHLWALYFGSSLGFMIMSFLKKSSWVLYSFQFLYIWKYSFVFSCLNVILG